MGVSKLGEAMRLLGQIAEGLLWREDSTSHVAADMIHAAMEREAFTAMYDASHAIAGEWLESASEWAEAFGERR